MSSSFVKILDNSLFPAAVMILGKLLGVVLATATLNIPFSIKEYADSIFSVRAVVRAEDLLSVTSYSDLIMFLTVALFLTFSVFRAVFLHSSHVKPTLVSRLANNNLLKLIRNSYEIYHYAVVWIIFTWVSNILIFINIYRGLTYSWIGITTLLFSILMTVVLLQDVYKEIENIKHKPGGYQWG
jgi:hypothetical protein